MKIVICDQAETLQCFIHKTQGFYWVHCFEHLENGSCKSNFCGWSSNENRYRCCKDTELEFDDYKFLW